MIQAMDTLAFCQLHFVNQGPLVRPFIIVKTVIRLFASLPSRHSPRKIPMPKNKDAISTADSGNSIGIRIMAHQFIFIFYYLRFNVKDQGCSVAMYVLATLHSTYHVSIAG